MSTLEQISQPIISLQQSYNDYVREQITIDDQESSMMLRYIFENKGKGVRPLLTMLSGSVFGCEGEVSCQRIFLSAMIIEMVHTASLIHDDIIDEAYIRRSKPSVNALWGQKKAVLIGDYIFAKSYSLGMKSGHFDIISSLAHVMTEICEGELLQDSQTKSLTMTQDIYQRITYGKTASLISSCSYLGAVSVGAEAKDAERFRDFGRNLGMAFQIKDDILDFSKEASTGKLACNDLKERKITLPLLSVMETSSPSVRKEIIRKISSVNTRAENIDFLYNMVLNEGGIDKSTQIMKEFVDKSKSILSFYPDNIYTASLSHLCDFMLERKK